MFPLLKLSVGNSRFSSESLCCIRVSPALLTAITALLIVHQGQLGYVKTWEKKLGRDTCVGVARCWVMLPQLSVLDAAVWHWQVSSCALCAVAEQFQMETDV